MPTTNTNFTSLITAIDTKAQSLAASTTDPKDLVFLGKAVEALNIPDSVSAIISEGDTQVGLVQTEGSTQVAAVQAAAVGFAPLAGATFTGAVTIPDLTVTGTTTTINSATLDIADINITIADGAANSAAADGAGLTIEGAGVNFQWSDARQDMSLNKGLAVREIKEGVTTETSTTGVLNHSVMGGAVRYLTANQTANRTINFRGDTSTSLDTIMRVGDSVTIAILATQGSTAYYFNTVQVDTATVTPKWQGGAPTEGTASGIDTYSFTIIKTASATFTVLASVAAFE